MPPKGKRKREGLPERQPRKKAASKGKAREDSDEAPFTMEDLCEECKETDFEKALAVPPGEIEDMTEKHGLVIAELGTRFLSYEETGCALCRMLFEQVSTGANVKGPIHEASFTLRAFSFLFTAFVFMESELYGKMSPQDSIVLLAVQNGIDAKLYVSDMRDNYQACGRSLVLLKHGAAEGIFKPRAIPRLYEPENIKSWMSECRENHSATCQHSVEVSRMRLIDCEKKMIVEAPLGQPWVALSYRWGPTNAARTRSVCNGQPGDLLPRKTPQVIEDAIEVTRSLDYRYLWVDRYCISQRNYQHKMDQIQKMDMIYRGADLTIIASGSADEREGLPGVTKERSRQDIFRFPSATLISVSPDIEKIHIRTRSAWASRGWTFQEEYLSRRRLYFTSKEVVFDCAGQYRQESITAPHLHSSPETKALYHQITQRIDTDAWYALLMEFFTQSAQAHTHQWRGSYTDHWGAFSTLLSEYTERALSFDSDSLNAFSGIMRIFQRVACPIYNVVGIRYVVIDSSVSAQVAEVSFITGLCWYHISPSRRRTTFPSWTWAGWEGPIDWPFARLWGTDSLIARHIPYIKGPRIENALHICQPLAEFLGHHQRAEIDQNPLPSPGAVLFDAMVLTLDKFSFEESEPSWDKCFVALPGSSRLLRIWDSRGMPGDLQYFANQMLLGKWSCLLFMDFGNLIALLVVEWQDDQTASRVGLIILESDGSSQEAANGSSTVSGSAVVDGADFLSKSTKDEWRKVRLV